MVWLLCLMGNWSKGRRKLASVNSLAPGKCGSTIRSFILNIQNSNLVIQYSVKLLSGKCHRTSLINNKSTSVQVTAWCHLAMSHYLNQCSPRSMSPFSVTRPQQVDLKWHTCNWPVLSLNSPMCRAVCMYCLLQLIHNKILLPFCPLQ